MSHSTLHTPEAAASAPAVALREVRKVHGRGDGAVVALDGVNVRLAPGSFTAIMGPSGSGKSTFLNVAAGLDRPTSGTVALCGTDLARLSEPKLTILPGERIGFVFQVFNLLPSLTVAQNIALPLRLDGRRTRRSDLSAVAVTPTTLGPSLGISDDTISAVTLNGGQGGGLDAGVTSGSLTALHGQAIALGRQRAAALHVHVAGHQTSPLLGTILVQTNHPGAVAHRLRALAQRYPGQRVSDRASLTTATDGERETNRWLGPPFVVIIFAFTSIAVINTLMMIALQRGRELGLLRLVGASRGHVCSMARWEAALIITIGLGLGLAIAAAAVLPLSHALTGSVRPYVPLGQLAAILGVSALLALLGLMLPTRRALPARPIEAIGIGD